MIDANGSDQRQLPRFGEGSVDQLVWLPKNPGMLTAAGWQARSSARRLGLRACPLTQREEARLRPRRCSSGQRRSPARGSLCRHLGRGRRQPAHPGDPLTTARPGRAVAWPIPNRRASKFDVVAAPITSLEPSAWPYLSGARAAVAGAGILHWASSGHAARTSEVGGHLTKQFPIRPPRLWSEAGRFSARTREGEPHPEPGRDARLQRP